MKQEQFNLYRLLFMGLMTGLLALNACIGPALPTTEPTETAVEEPAAVEEPTAALEAKRTEEATAAPTTEAADEPVAQEAAAAEESPVAVDGAGTLQGSEVVAEGFNGPMGVYVADDGSIWVVESGVGGDEEIAVVGPQGPITATMGLTSRVVQIAPDGTQTEVAALPSLMMGMEASGASRIVLVEGVPYVTVGGYVGAPEDERPPLFGAVVRIEDGEVDEVANTWAFEAENNPDGFVYESHPYDITADNEGNLWVTEAGANALLKIAPETGAIELVAVFPGVPGLPFPNANRGGAQELDPVPTGVVLADDGTIYVSYLPGFPPIPDGKVVTVAPDTGTVADYAGNVNMLTDLAMGPDGILYAVRMADFGEQGPVPNTGSILRIKEGDGPEQVVGGLSFPTAISFDAEGNAYITINGVGAPGTGAVLRIDGLTELAGEPVPAPARPAS